LRLIEPVKNEDDWTKHCTTMSTDGIRRLRDMAEWCCRKVMVCQ